MADKTKNVNSTALAFFADGVGFHKDGYCRTAEGDKRHLSVAAIMSHAFHQSEFGDDDYNGISAGQKTCISAYDFKRAIRENKIGPDLAPKVYLSATDEKALDVLTIEELKRYATKEK